MTIVASGEISLGGNATTTRSVACEIERSGTAQICMDETQVRTLAARTSAASAICMDNFYGRTFAPTAIGQAYRGGYYTGTVASPGNYYLVIAPNATGCANCQWKTTNTRTGVNGATACNLVNGYWNTFTYLNNTDHPAGNWIATRSIGGFSDWYLPARDELNVLYQNKNSMPVGERYAGTIYHASSEPPADCVRSYIQTFTFGVISCFTKVCTYPVRATRRVAF